MATAGPDLVFVASLPATRRVQLLNQVKDIERKAFPKADVFDFDAECRKANTKLLVALLDGAVVGYLVTCRMKRAASIHKVCVASNYRQNGCGSLLVAKAVAELESTGCSRVELWVDTERFAARRLYTRAGFDEVNTVEDYYGPGRHAIKMILGLPR